MPEPAKTRGTRGRLEFLAQIGSLIATAWIMGNFAALPRAVFSAPASLLWRAVQFTVVAWAWSAAVSLVLQIAIRRVEHVDVARSTLRISSVAVWFAPATLLMYQFSPATVIAALVLVVNATRLLYAQWKVFNPTPEPLPWIPGEDRLLETGEMPPPMLTRNLGPSLVVATGLQLGVAAALFRDHFLAGTLLTLTTAMLTVFAISAGAWETSRQPTLPRSVFGMVLTLILAAALTIIAVGGRGTGFGFGFGAGEGDGDEASSRPMPGFLAGRPSRPNVAPAAPGVPAAPAGGAAATSPEPPEIPGMGDVAGSFQGVVLWPEIKPVTILIAPMPSTPSAFAAASVPYGIPFGGEYWFFRWPFTRPPRTSYKRRGTPSKVGFSTTDRMPLNMEAHQKLSQDVDIACCSRIEVAIANADSYPNTVSLELMVRKLPNERAQSLGIVPVHSTPNLKADPVVAVGETLDFQVPPEPQVREFNELSVVYHRARVRGDKSARVSIERFILIPHGR